ncbi:hypothetical protein FOVSG1_014764 [Fusarium oxysporum f. sp. vasinfectum]
MTTNRRSRLSGFRCASTGRVTAALLLSFLAFSPSSAHNNIGDRFHDDILLPPGPALPVSPEVPAPAEHTFSLRHIYHHGTHLHPGLHRKRDVFHDESRVYLAAEDEYGEYDVSRLKAKSHSQTIQRLVDRRPSVVDPMVAESRQRGYAAVLDASAWTMDQVSSPDIKDKDTVLTLAIMTANAYVKDETETDWEDVGERWNRSADFGWESDGLRGHIFVDDTNSTIVIGLKGQRQPLLQLLLCPTREENRYYGAARELYSNVTELYPDAQVWLTGHSLGGAVTSMLGMTYGLPVVTFEAVPEALPASRLGLPVPPGASADYPQMRENTGTFHFGHTADPVYIGTCNGATASCTYGGYAMESACHAGYECVYDVVADKGWRVGIGTHRIRSVIDDVIKKYDGVPECRRTPECRDCAQWKMYESNGTETTTTSSSPTSTSMTTRTRTRTSTCETPGWWGCLDKTTPASTTTSTTSTSTSTCKTPGWFGCKDKTTTESSTTTTVDATPTTTCHTPGRFWGCRDEVEATTTAEPGQVTNAPVTAAPTGTTEDVPSTSVPESQRCLTRSWFGLCKEWVVEDMEFAPDEM